nr:hypothetical protein [Streptococcus canis]
MDKLLKRLKTGAVIALVSYLLRQGKRDKDLLLATISAFSAYQYHDMWK